MNKNILKGMGIVLLLSLFLINGCGNKGTLHSLLDKENLDLKCAEYEQVEISAIKVTYGYCRGGGSGSEPLCPILVTETFKEGNTDNLDLRMVESIETIEITEDGKCLSYEIVPR